MENFRKQIEELFLKYKEADSSLWDQGDIYQIEGNDELFYFSLKEILKNHDVDCEIVKNDDTYDLYHCGNHVLEHVAIRPIFVYLETL